MFPARKKTTPPRPALTLLRVLMSGKIGGKVRSDGLLSAPLGPSLVGALPGMLPRASPDFDGPPTTSSNLCPPRATEHVITNPPFNNPRHGGMRTAESSVSPIPCGAGPDKRGAAASPKRGLS